jgi:hypothetical protein
LGWQFASSLPVASSRSESARPPTTASPASLTRAAFVMPSFWLGRLVASFLNKETASVAPLSSSHPSLATRAASGARVPQPLLRHGGHEASSRPRIALVRGISLRIRHLILITYLRAAYVWFWHRLLRCSRGSRRRRGRRRRRRFGRGPTVDESRQQGEARLLRRIGWHGSTVAGLSRWRGEPCSNLFLLAGDCFPGSSRMFVHLDFVRLGSMQTFFAVGSHCSM